MAITSKDMKRIVHRMRICSGDVVLIKNNTELGDFDSIQRLSDVLKQAGKQNVVILVVDNFDDIKSLPEQEMASHGWLRREKIEHLVLRKIKPPEKQEEEDVDD